MLPDREIALLELRARANSGTDRLLVSPGPKTRGLLPINQTEQNVKRDLRFFSHVMLLKKIHRFIVLAEGHVTQKPECSQILNKLELFLLGKMVLNGFRGTSRRRTIARGVVPH